MFSLRTVAKTPDIITSVFTWSWLVGWSQNKEITLHLLQMALGWDSDIITGLERSSVLTYFDYPSLFKLYNRDESGCYLQKKKVESQKC